MGKEVWNQSDISSISMISIEKRKVEKKWRNMIFHGKSDQKISTSLAIKSEMLAITSPIKMN